MKCVLISATLFLTQVILAGCAATPPSAAAPLKGLSPGDPLYAYVEAARDDLSRGKVEIITAVMHLDAEQSKLFWPIYQEYEVELFDLGDKRLELIRQFIPARQSGRLDDKKAGELADGYFQFELARLELVKRYHAEIAKALSPLCAAQFTQIEHRMNTVIDLLIASEMPLVQGAAGLTTN